MNSKITIEIDFENGNEPVIQIISRKSDDIRDKLISLFLERLGGFSSWCKITCVTSSVSEEPIKNFQKWRISPIRKTQFKAEGEALLEQHRLLREWEHPNS